MNKEKTRREDTVINRVTMVGTLSLLCLLLIFLFVSISGTNSITSQVRLLTEHPFTVSRDVYQLKTDLALMRIRTERLQSYNQPSDVEKVRESLQDLYVEMNALLNEIYSLYLGPEEDVQNLRASYEEIRQAQNLFLEFSSLPSSTTTVIAEYEQEHLYQLYDTFDECVNQIIDYTNSTQLRVFSTAKELSQSTVIWCYVITITTAVGLFFFQHSIRKMSWQLYQSTLQFEVLSDTIDETFMIFDEAKSDCDFVSGSAERVLGIPAEKLSKNRKLLYQNLSTSVAHEVQEKLLSKQSTSWEKTVEYLNPLTRHTCWLQLSFYRTSQDDGAKSIMTLTDRTEERRANQALSDALDSAQRANNAKKDFLSRMSHEIRTPINAIVGMTTIAAASIDNHTKVEDCLEKIAFSSKHLLMLINDVLDMSRIENNRISVNLEPFELMQFLNTFSSVIYPQAVAKGLEFSEKHIGFSEHTTYIGDSLRLNQILLNLMSNAIKFTPSGGKVNLEVTNLPSRGEKCWIRFVVTDTGIGMDDQGLSRLYTPFEQADSSIARKYGGTGLGMSITQNLVSMMGGYINVESQLGNGTSFTVDLPFEHSDTDLHPLRDGALEGLEVLVVDDEQDICEHAVLLLKKMKIHAEWVLSGLEAVNRVVAAQQSGSGFDVCFIDWKMPEMDGIETTRQIRKKVGPDTPIIIISAYDWSEIEHEARAAGVNAFISKPIFQSSIYNALVSVANGTAGAQDLLTFTEGHSLDGRRLLLAEDNLLNTEIVETLLEMNGAEVESVKNGQEAVDRFLQMQPGYYDAILMDVQMPVMDGLEATRQIRDCERNDAKTIPIIATTANAFEEDVSIALAAGMNAHIAKPIDIKNLCIILNRFISESSRLSDSQPS